MATTPTTNFGWLMPVPGTEIDTWGPIVNTVFDDIDAEVFLKANIAGQVFTGQIVTPNGTVAAPGLGIGGTGSGLYVIGASNLGLSIAGVRVLSLTPTNITFDNTAGAAQIVAQATGAGALFRAERYDNSLNAPAIQGRKGRGTAAVPVVVNNGDIALSLTGQIYDGVGIGALGSINVEVFEVTPSPTARGSKIRLEATQVGTASTAYALTLDSTNGVQMQSATVIDAARAHVLRAYTVATVPSASPAGRLIQVTDEVGGTIPAFSDGTNWRRVTDRQIVST